MFSSVLLPSREFRGLSWAFPAILWLKQAKDEGQFRPPFAETVMAGAHITPMGLGGVLYDYYLGS